MAINYMKLFLALLILAASGAIASAQLTITNNVKVALSTNDDNALRLAWKLDSNSRTNGLPPYSGVTNAITYAQFQDWLGTEAFRSIAQTLAAQNEAQVLRMYRTATDADRARVARILSGLSN